jgi:hypothetical protein
MAPIYKEATHARAHEMPSQDHSKDLPSFLRTDSSGLKGGGVEATVFIELRLRV